VSETAPGDLAVAFRSLERRLREALEPARGDRSVAAPMIAELDQVVQDAARAIGAPPGSSASAVAAAIDARPADAWQESELQALRGHALDAGRLLRAIAAAAEAAADG